MGRPDLNLQRKGVKARKGKMKEEEPAPKGTSPKKRRLLRQKEECFFFLKGRKQGVHRREAERFAKKERLNKGRRGENSVPQDLWNLTTGKKL